MEEKTKEKCARYGMDTTYTELTMSFFFKLLLFGVVWLFGYMNWNFSWIVLPTAFIVLTNKKKKDGQLRRLTAQATALSKEKIVVESRIDELPSWVFFPDYSRVEWLNEMVLKLWPTISVSDRFKSQVQKILTKPLLRLKKKVPGMGSGVHFEKVYLGKIPPKIMGVKVHNRKHTKSDEILLDMDIMYAGDCDITFLMGNMIAGVQDFQLRGTARVILKSLIPIEPFVGGFQMFFLNRPIIDFQLTGVAEVLDLPGVDNAFRRLLGQKLAKKFVLPNKYTKILSKKISVKHLKVPEPKAVLRIHVIEAVNLEAKDRSLFKKDKSDPYVVITVGAQEFKTKTIDCSVNPKWDFWCEALIDSPHNQKLEITVWDEDPNIFGIQNDDFLGRTTIEVNRIKQKDLIDEWFPLKDVKHGTLHLSFTWFDLSSDPMDAELAMIERQKTNIPTISNAILILFIESAKNLPISENDEEPDVYVEASVGSNLVRTKKKIDTCNPEWHEGLTLFVSNFETGMLHLKVYDLKTSNVLGTFAYNISSLLEQKNLETKIQPYNLQSNYMEGEISFSMALKILKHKKTVPADDDSYENEVNDNGSMSSDLPRQDSNVSDILATTKFLNGQAELQKSVSEECTEYNDSEYINNTLESESDISRRSISLNGTHNLSRKNSEDVRVKIKLTLEYSVARQKLAVVVHQIESSFQVESSANPDLYVKMYLIPNKSKETKLKTSIVKSNGNPIFDEKFEYVMSQIEISTQYLEISVKTHRNWFKKSTKCIGQTVIKLSTLKPNEPVTNWYELEPESRFLKTPVI